MFRELEQLAPNVYVFPHDATPNTVQPCVGLLKTPRQTILIDAGNSPHHARQVMAAMAGMRFSHIDTIIYTHHHWDHTFGAISFNAPNIIAHESNTALLREYAMPEWSLSAMQTLMERQPEVAIRYRTILRTIHDWRDFSLCYPNITFSNRMELHYDGFPVILQHVGGRHAEDSIVVRIPDAGVIFLGDSYYPPPVHLRDPEDHDLDLAMLEEIISEEYDVYVDGHGTPRSRAELRSMIEQERVRQQSNA